jgi:hypothetical protein
MHSTVTRVCAFFYIYLNQTVILPSKQKTQNFFTRSPFRELHKNNNDEYGQEEKC